MYKKLFNWIPGFFCLLFLSSCVSTETKNTLNVQNQTIKDNEVTVDYEYYSSEDRQGIIFVIYIDEIKYHFIVDFGIHEVSKNRRDYSFSLKKIEANDDAEIFSSFSSIESDNELLPDDHGNVISDLDNMLITFLSSHGIDEKNVNIISKIIRRKIYEEIK
jgi:hypothetical protein